MKQSNSSNQSQEQNNPNPGKQVDRPDETIVNEQEQNDVVNPGDNDYDEDDKKEEGYDEGNRDDSNTENENNEDVLPGEDDDSGKTIRETPKMEE